MGILGGICVAALAAAPVFEPGTAEILFEREMDPSLLQRYEISGPYVSLERNVTREDVMAMVEAARSNPLVARIELYSPRGERYLRHLYPGRDRILEAEDYKLTQLALETFTSGLEPKQKFKGFTFMGRWALSSDGPIVFREPPQPVCFSEAYRGPRGEIVDVSIFDGNDRPISIHQLLRPLVGDECRAVKGRPGYVVRSTRRPPDGNSRDTVYRIAWLSGGGKAFYVTATGVDPEPLVALWARKFPSSLTRDLRIDKLAWARAEFDYWLNRMKKAAAAPPGIDYWIGRSRAFPEHAAYFDGEVRAIPWYVRNAEKTVVFPHTDGGLLHDMPTDKLREQYRLLEEWWPKVKEKTYWDKKRQLLMAPGYTPGELRARAKKRERARIDAILNVPITEGKKAAILAGAGVALEEYIGGICERGRKAGDSDSRWEKVDDATWRFVHRRYMSDPAGSPLIVEAFTGPRSQKLSDNRRYPFGAVFDKQVTYPGAKNPRSSVLVFRYDKLKGKWIKK